MVFLDPQDVQQLSIIVNKVAPPQNFDGNKSEDRLITGTGSQQTVISNWLEIWKKRCPKSNGIWVKKEHQTEYYQTTSGIRKRGLLEKPLLVNILAKGGTVKPLKTDTF